MDLLRETREALDLKVTPRDLANDKAVLGELLELEEEYLAIGAWAAGQDVNAYNEFVYETQQHPFHEALQALCDAHPLLSVDAPVEHGKSTQVSVVRPGWKLGRNPNLTYMVLSNSATIPHRCYRQLVATIEHNPRYHLTFPHIKIEKSSEQDGLYLFRPTLTAKDPSYWGGGILGSVIGTRATDAVLDDLLDQEIATSPALTERVDETLKSTVLRRRTHLGSLCDLGTPWFVHDSRHKMRKLPGFHVFRFDAEDGLHYFDKNQMAHDIPGAIGPTLWPVFYLDPESGQQYGWPLARLMKVKDEEMDQATYDRQLRCIPWSLSQQIFKPEHLMICLELGKGLPWPRMAPRGAPVVSGVDLATGRDQQGDLTVVTTGYTEGGTAHPCDIRSGYWQWPRIIEEVKQLVNTYPNHKLFLVEDNASQRGLVDILCDKRTLRGYGWTDVEMARLHVAGATTGENKYSSEVGVQGMAVTFEQHRVVLPSNENGFPVGEIKKLYEGLTSYTVDRSKHTSDHVISFWLYMLASRSYDSLGDGGDLRSKYGIG